MTPPAPITGLAMIASFTAPAESIPASPLPGQRQGSPAWKNSGTKWPGHLLAAGQAGGVGMVLQMGRRMDQVAPVRVQWGGVRDLGGIVHGVSFLVGGNIGQGGGGWRSFPRVVISWRTMRAPAFRPTVVIPDAAPLIHLAAGDAPPARCR